MAATEKCGTCNKNVSDSDHGLLCEICESWYHSKCQKVNDAYYKLLIDYSDKLHWFCTSCNASCGKIITALAKISNRLDKLKTSSLEIVNSQQADSKRIADISGQMQTDSKNSPN